MLINRSAAIPQLTDYRLIEELFRTISEQSILQKKVLTSNKILSRKEIGTLFQDRVNIHIPDDKKLFPSIDHGPQPVSVS